MEVKKMTDSELINEYKSLDYMIYEAECYGTRDLFLLEAVGQELERRGYDIEISNKVTITK